MRTTQRQHQGFASLSRAHRPCPSPSRCSHIGGYFPRCTKAPLRGPEASHATWPGVSGDHSDTAESGELSDATTKRTGERVSEWRWRESNPRLRTLSSPDVSAQAQVRAQIHSYRCCPIFTVGDPDFVSYACSRVARGVTTRARTHGRSDHTLRSCEWCDQPSHCLIPLPVRCGSSRFECQAKSCVTSLLRALTGSAMVWT